MNGLVKKKNYTLFRKALRTNEVKLSEKYQVSHQNSKKVDKAFLEYNATYRYEKYNFFSDQATKYTCLLYNII